MLWVYSRITGFTSTPSTSNDRLNTYNNKAIATSSAYFSVAALQINASSPQDMHREVFQPNTHSGHKMLTLSYFLQPQSAISIINLIRVLKNITS